MLEKIYDLIMNIINYLGLYGPLFGCFLICIESIVPILPLSVFITLNFISFGNIIGFIVSWICTLIGCTLSFFLFRKSLRKIFQRKTSNMEKVRKIMRFLDNGKFQNLVLLLSIPFTPAFLVNIAAGLSNMKYKKFFLAIFISKIFLVFFWGYVGTTLIQSLTNPISLVKVLVISLIAYVISSLVNKKFNID